MTLNAMKTLRQLTKKEYKNILRNQRRCGQEFTKKERSKLKKLTFEEVVISDEGFIVVGDTTGSMDWLANNLPSRCCRVSDALKDRSIQ